MSDRDLFAIQSDAKDLHDNKTYEDYEQRLNEVLDSNPGLKHEIIGQSDERDMHVVYAGNPDSDKRIFITAGHHGGEVAGPLATLEILREIADPQTPMMEHLLEDAYIAVVPCIDAQGYDHQGRKFVDLNGNGELWPLDKGRWWSDINGTHGRRNEESKSEEVRATQGVLEDFKPTIVFDLHETVSSLGSGPTSPLMATQGVMVIQDVPEGKVGVGKNITRNSVDRGFDIYHDGFIEKVVLPLIPQPDQVVKKEEAIYEVGPLIDGLGISVFTMWAREHGAEGYTFETFENPLSYRVDGQVAGVEGGIMAHMGYSATERLGSLKGKVEDVDALAGKFFDQYEVRTHHVGKYTYQTIRGDGGEIDVYGAWFGKSYVDVRLAPAFEEQRDRMEAGLNELQSEGYKDVGGEKIDKIIDGKVLGKKGAFLESVESIAAAPVRAVRSGMRAVHEWLTDNSGLYEDVDGPFSGYGA